MDFYTAKSMATDLSELEYFVLLPLSTSKHKH